MDDVIVHLSHLLGTIDSNHRGHSAFGYRAPNDHAQHHALTLSSGQLPDPSRSNQEWSLQLLCNFTLVMTPPAFRLLLAVAPARSARGLYSLVRICCPPPPSFGASCQHPYYRHFVSPAGPGFEGQTNRTNWIVALPDFGQSSASESFAGMASCR